MYLSDEDYKIRRMVKMCMTKTRFEQKMEAERSAHQRLTNGGIPLRVYTCDLCKGYHLTKRLETDRREGA